MAWQVVSLLLFSTSFSFIILTNSQEVHPPGVNCEFSTGNYTKNSLFHTNLLNAFSNLTSLSSSNTFSNFTAGSDADDTSKVNALYDCRLDLSHQACHDCVEAASMDILQLCSSFEAIAISEGCMLRYANRRIVSILDTKTVPYLACNYGIADGGELYRTIKPIFTRLINEVTENSSSRYFGAEEESYFKYQKVYCLVQCTPDISRDECRNCLMDGLMNFTLPCAEINKLVSMFYGPNCQLRYDFLPFSYLFTGFTPIGSSPPMLSPEGSQVNIGEGGQRFISSMVFVFLFFSFLIFY